MSNLPEEEKYAPDLPSAESQRHRDPEGTLAPDILAHSETVNFTIAPNLKNNSHYAAHYGPDALIWSLYLKETEAEDRELVQLWQTGLDSLLVFAGLFAGILTAFLIESRRGLQQDSAALSASLLEEILHTLRNDSNVSTSPSFQPSASSLPVNYLWFISLTLTLASALGGVLAKGWLTKYSPASPGVSASDACERHLRAIRAHQWHFGTLITAIPLLLQLSLFLFFAGLVIFILNDDNGIGFTTLALVLVIAGIYLLGTVLPWFSPACPFQTTMSDFIPGVTAKAQYRSDHTSSYGTQRAMSGQSWSLWDAFWQFIAEVHHKPKPEELETSILAWIIGNSAVETTIEEAVRVVAGMPPMYVDEFRKSIGNSGAFPVFCQRFSRCFKSTPGFPLVAENVDLTEAYLYTLLSIVRVDPNMSLTLWQPGGPLHRWDELQPCLHSLAFCVRTEILLAAGYDDHREGWEQTKQNLASMAQTGSPPDVQKMLMKVAIQCVGTEKHCLQSTGTLLLNSLVKIGNMDIVPAWPSNIGHHEAITNILALLQDEETDISNTALECIIKLSTYSDFHKSFDAAVPQVMKLLHTMSPFESPRIIGRLAKHTPFYNVIKGSIYEIIKLLKNGNQRIQSCGISAIVTLAEHAQFHDTIKNVFPDITILLKDSSEDVQLAAAEVIQNLARDVTFHDLISDIIPDIIILLKDNKIKLQLRSASIIETLAEHAKFCDALKSILSDIMAMVKSNNLELRAAGGNVIGKLAEHSLFCDSISNIFPDIMMFLNNNNWEIQYIGASIIEKLARHTPFHDMIKKSFPDIIILLKDNNKNVQLAGANLIAELVRHTQFHDTIKDGLIFAEIIMLLRNNNFVVSSAGASIIERFAKQTPFHDLLKDNIFDIVNLLKDNDEDVSFQAANIIGLLAEHVQFHDEIKNILPDVIMLLKNNSRQMYSSGGSIIGKFVKDGLFHDEIKSHISDFINLLKDSDTTVQLGGLSVIENLAEQNQFHDLVKDAVPQIMKLLKSDLGVAWYAMPAIRTLAKSLDTLYTLLKTVPHLVPHASENDSIREIVCIIVESVAQQADSDTTSWFTDVFSVVLSNPSIGATITQSSDLLHSPVDHNNLPTSNSLLSSFEKLTSQELEVRHTGIQCLSVWVHYIQEFPIGMVYFSRQIVSQLKSKTTTIQHGATVALAKWAKYTQFYYPIKLSISHIIELLKSKNENVRSDGAMVIEELAKHTSFHDVIKEAFCDLVTLLKGSDDFVGSTGANIIGQLAEHTPFHDTIKDSFPDLIMLLKDNNENVQSAGICTIEKLAKHTQFDDTIRDSFPDLVMSLKDNNGKVWSNGASIIGKLAEHAQFHDAIRTIFPDIIRSLRGNKQEIWSGTLVVEKLAALTLFHNSISNIFSDIVMSLKDDHWAVRLGGAHVIEKLAEHITFHDAIRGILPDIIILLKDEDGIVQLAGADVIGLLAEHTLFQDAIKSSLDITMSLKNNSWNDQSGYAVVIGKLAKHTSFYDEIRGIFPDLIMSLKNDNYWVKSTSSTTIEKLANHTQFYDVIKGSFPDLIILLKNEDEDMRLTTASVIEKISKQTLFYDAIMGIFSDVVGLLKDNYWPIRLEAAHIIENLAEHTEFHDTIKNIIPNIIGMLKDDNEFVQSAGAKIIKKIVAQNLINDSLITSLTSLVKTETSHGLSIVLDILSQLPTCALSTVVQQFTPSDLITLLHHKDTKVSVSSAQLFGALAFCTKSHYPLSLSSAMDEFTCLTMKVISYALSCLEHSSDDIKGRGISILTVLIDCNDVFRDIICEVGGICGFLQLCMGNISPAKVDELLNCMNQFGILQTL